MAYLTDTVDSDKFNAAQHNAIEAAQYNQMKACPPPAPPLDEIGSALASARELAARIQALAEKVLGPTDMACGSKNGIGPANSGTLLRLQALSGETRDDINAANRACSRLESALSA